MIEVPREALLHPAQPTVTPSAHILMDQMCHPGIVFSFLVEATQAVNNRSSADSSQIDQFLEIACWDDSPQAISRNVAVQRNTESIGQKWLKALGRPPLSFRASSGEFSRRIARKRFADSNGFPERNRAAPRRINSLNFHVCKTPILGVEPTRFKRMVGTSQLYLGSPLSGNLFSFAQPPRSSSFERNVFAFHQRCVVEYRVSTCFGSKVSQSVYTDQEKSKYCHEFQLGSAATRRSTTV
jgi:hypothetical protein